MLEEDPGTMLHTESIKEGPPLTQISKKRG